MRTRFIQNEILVILSDEKIHTANDISNELDVSVKTIYRHLNDLSIIYPISSFHGGYIKGYQLKGFKQTIFSLWEIDFLLELLPTDINSKKVEILKNKLMLLSKIIILY